jgi:hypothetical protein
LPENGAENIDKDTTIQWSCSDPDKDILRYDLYFGTSNPPPKYQSDIVDTVFSLASLEYQTTYFWYVVAKDWKESTVSPVWSFTTETGNQPPVAFAGRDTTVEAVSPLGAEVSLDGSGSSDPDNDALLFTWLEKGDTLSGPTPNALSNITLPLDRHAIQLVVSDQKGGYATDDVIWNVIDTVPPELHVSLVPDTLWPPNNKMVNITATIF